MGKYSKEDLLSNEFNSIVSEVMGIPSEDYLSKISDDNLVRMKILVKNINNVLTLRLTQKVAGWICKNQNFDSSKVSQVLRTIDSTKPNANGFDIEIDDPRIVVEIKCNIPINDGNRFGSKQAEGIRKDIMGLLNGKTKSSVDTSKAIKILGLSNVGRAKEAAKNLVSSLDINIRRRIVFCERAADIDLKLDKLYVLIL